MDSKYDEKAGVDQYETQDVKSDTESGILEFNEHQASTARHGSGSSFLAYFNVVCVIAGTGTLGLPAALKLGGWIGLLILFLAWTLSIYTGCILIKCLYSIKGRRLESYKEVATTAFGRIGGWIIFFFNAWILLGAPILYVLLAGQNLHSLLINTSAALTAVQWKVIVACILLIPFIVVKNMKEVAFMSTVGALATVICVLIVVVVSLKDKDNYVGVEHDVVIWNQFPIALSTISFSFGGNVVYPHVEASMARPRQWKWVVTAGLSTCAVLYYLTAVPGYYVYGIETLSPIYENLPDGAAKIAATSVITIHVVLAAPILITSFALDVEYMFGITVERRGKFLEFAFRAINRAVILAFVTVIACVVPYFADIMSLVGSFSNCMCTFAFPVFCYLKLTGFRNKPIYELVVCGLCVLLGIVGLIFGTIDSVRALIADFQG
ncbi:transmembrane amino acid transporter protein-domain-containing protein [Umbelopsis sp. PMI_123]|nr:transmembrane amino acid transporter protein-domain-containing protein [Umbelopsis sp. PMI_123]